MPNTTAPAMISVVAMGLRMQSSGRFISGSAPSARTPHFDLGAGEEAKYPVGHHQLARAQPLGDHRGVLLLGTYVDGTLLDRLVGLDDIDVGALLAALHRLRGHHQRVRHRAQ